MGIQLIQKQRPGQMIQMRDPIGNRLMKALEAYFTPGKVQILKKRKWSRFLLTRCIQTDLLFSLEEILMGDKLGTLGLDILLIQGPKACQTWDTKTKIMTSGNVSHQNSISYYSRLN